MFTTSVKICGSVEKTYILSEFNNLCYNYSIIICGCKQFMETNLINENRSENTFEKIGKSSLF